MVMRDKAVGRCTYAVLFALLATCLFISGSTLAVAKARHAFVVGINAYDKLPPRYQLERANADAKAMAATLGRLGFRVMHDTDLSRARLSRLWDQFVSRIKPGDIAAVFFAGHGVEIDNVNYLLPSDSPHIAYGRERRLRRESISVSEMLVDLRERKPSITWLMLDACRNHPLRPPPGARATIQTTGLASMAAAKGEFIMYSAGAGQFALDKLPGHDPSPNSLFTRHLLTVIAMPGLALNDIARQTRARVYAAAQQASSDQRPAYYDNVIGRFCPAGCSAAGKDGEQPAVIATAPTGVPDPGSDRDAADDEDAGFWSGLFRGGGPSTSGSRAPSAPAAPAAPRPPTEPRARDRSQTAALSERREGPAGTAVCFTPDMLNFLVGRDAAAPNRKAGLEIEVGSRFCARRSADDDAPSATVTRIASRAVRFLYDSGRQFTCLTGQHCQFDWPGSPVFEVVQRQTGGERNTFLRILK
ncbi:MAG: caspase family protein [Pseudomonadota bacterium]